MCHIFDTALCRTQLIVTDPDFNTVRVDLEGFSAEAPLQVPLLVGPEERSTDNLSSTPNAEDTSPLLSNAEQKLKQPWFQYKFSSHKKMPLCQILGP